MALQVNYDQAGRLAFADLLRGLAALIVVLGHYTLLYPTSPEIVAALTFGEGYEAVTLPATLNSLLSWINFASIGVAVFFLISGFVIPLSLEGTNTRAYFLKRFMRIFPTYWIALVIAVAVLFVSASFWSKSLPLTAVDYISSTFLLANAFSRPDIVSVAWTLQIEIKFYLLAPFIYMALKRGTLWPIFLCGLAVVGVFWNATAVCDNVHIACWDHYRFGARMMWADTMFMVFMLVGSVFYAHYRKLVSTWKALFAVLFLLGCYHAAVSAAPLDFVAMDRRVPYMEALLIFASFYLVRDRIVLTRPFRFLADISYSLYLTHCLLGYVMMRLLMFYGVPYLAAFALALASAIGLATIIYVQVEAPLIALGKRLSRAWFAPRKRENALSAEEVPASI